MAEEGEDEDFPPEGINNAESIRELIKYIQKSAKTYRHGLEYAKIKLITQGKFLRPKVWSSTRMVVYEFDMVERFLATCTLLNRTSAGAVAATRAASLHSRPLLAVAALAVMPRA